MGEDDSGFGLLGHVAAPHQLGLPRGLLALNASHGRIVIEIRVRGGEAARSRLTLPVTAPLVTDNAAAI
jgi:hypothetical protein